MALLSLTVFLRTVRVDVPLLFRRIVMAIQVATWRFACHIQHTPALSLFALHFPGVATGLACIKTGKLFRPPSLIKILIKIRIFI